MHSELPPVLGGAQLEHGWSVAGRVELFRAAESGPDGVRALVVRWTGQEFVGTTACVRRQSLSWRPGPFPVGRVSSIVAQVVHADQRFFSPSRADGAAAQAHEHGFSSRSRPTRSGGQSDTDGLPQAVYDLRLRAAEHLDRPSASHGPPHRPDPLADA